MESKYLPTTTTRDSQKEIESYQLDLFSKGTQNSGTSKANLDEKFIIKSISVPKANASLMEKHLDLLKQLNHENIVRIVSYEVDILKHGEINIYHIFMDEAKCNLRKFIETDRSYFTNVENVFSFLKQMIAACKYLSSVNLVHANIKLENILVFEGPTFKLVDMGLPQKLTTLIPSWVMELIQNDIFSLGMVLCNICGMDLNISNIDEKLRNLNGEMEKIRARYRSQLLVQIISPMLSIKNSARPSLEDLQTQLTFATVPAVEQHNSGDDVEIDYNAIFHYQTLPLKHDILQVMPLSSKSLLILGKNWKSEALLTIWDVKTNKEIPLNRSLIEHADWMREIQNLIPYPYQTKPYNKSLVERSDQMMKLSNGKIMCRHPTKLFVLDIEEGQLLQFDLKKNDKSRFLG